MQNVAFSHSIGDCEMQQKTKTMRDFLKGYIRARGYKTFFFMLNSTEHEIFPAHKC